MQAAVACHPALDYRRAARRLRCRFRGDPLQLQLALRSLAHRVDAGEKAEKSAPQLSQLSRAVVSSLQTSSEAGERFAGLVRAMLNDDPILRHSRRQALLRQAGKLRIAPFDANLIIAAVEHRRTSRPVRSTVVGRSAAMSWPVPLLVGLALAVEGIGLGAFLAWIR